MLASQPRFLMGVDMSAFTGSDAVYPFLAAGTGRWEYALAEPLLWEVRAQSSGFAITIPAGFLTDLGHPLDPQLAILTAEDTAGIDAALSAGVAEGEAFRENNGL
jgi:hypothetical protein